MSALGYGTANFEAMEPEVSLGRVAKAAWDNASLGATTASAITSGIERGGLANIGEKQSPEKINKMFPGLNADRDITVSEAEYIMNRRQQMQYNQEIISKASDSFFKGTIVPFVSGAARSMLDPVDLGVGFITGGIGNGLAKGGSLARKIAIDAAEAATAATIAEAPVAMEMNETFEQYTAKNFVQNVALASVMQVGILHGGSAAFKGTAKSLEYAGGKTADGMLRVAESMENAGLKSDGFLNSTVDLIKRKFDNVEPLNMAVKNHLPENLIGDDFGMTMRNVIKAFEDGVVDEKQLTNFRAEAIENGVDPRMIDKVVDDGPLKFNEKEQFELSKTTQEESAKVDYDPKIVKIEKDLDNFSPEKILDEEIQATTTRLEAADLEAENVKFELDEGGEVQFNASTIKQDMEVGMKEQEFFKEFVNCRRGA